MTNLTFTQIENNWVRFGGDPHRKAIAAAIAWAESAGHVEATHHNPNGTWDNGLFQINRPGVSPGLLEIGPNIRTAIDMSHNGTNWRPWCTAYSDGACGTRGGCYMCAGTPALKALSAHGGTMVGGSGGAATVPDSGPPSSGAPSWDWSRWVGITHDQAAFMADAALTYGRGVAHLRK